VRALEEQTLETVAVRPSQSVWTVEAQSVETGWLYGIAAEPRMGAALLEALTELGRDASSALGSGELADPVEPPARGAD
jgi:ribosomal protein S12 methylthiotransferase accessory factor YcaO